MIGRRLASPTWRIGRIVVGMLMAVAALFLLQGIAAFLVIMLGAEIAVGGALNVCVLCPLFGRPFAGRDL